MPVLMAGQAREPRPLSTHLTAALMQCRRPCMPLCCSGVRHGPPVPPCHVTIAFCRSLEQLLDFSERLLGQLKLLGILDILFILGLNKQKQEEVQTPGELRSSVSSRGVPHPPRRIGAPSEPLPVVGGFAGSSLQILEEHSPNERVSKLSTSDSREA